MEPIYVSFLIQYLIGVFMTACASVVVATLLVGLAAMSRSSTKNKRGQAFVLSLLAGMLAILLLAFSIKVSINVADGQLFKETFGLADDNYQGLLGIVAGAVFPGILLLLGSVKLRDFLFERYGLMPVAGDEE